MSKSNVLGTVTVTSVAVVLLAGCTLYSQQALVGSGKSVTLEKDLSGFSRIDVSSAFQVDVTQSEDYSVVITVDEKVEPYLDVTVQGDTLRIAVRPGLTLGLGAHPMQAKVTMPQLRGIELSGASRAAVGGFRSGEGLDTKVSGASQLHGDIEAGDARFNVSGASRITLSGKGQKMALEASGASQADLSNFAVSEAAVEISGASKAVVNVSGKLDANVSGASTLRYVGNPTMGSINSSGASTIGRQ
jgi:hypothetical protein